MARIHRLARVLAAGALGLAVLPLSTSAPARAASASCGFGSGGPDATTICWLDMSAFNAAAAQTAAGQQMTISVTPSYTVSFTVHLAAGDTGLRNINAVAFPTWSGTPIGNAVYTGTPGKPALYQSGTGKAGGQGTITLSGIAVNGPGGGALGGYGFVTADAESTNAGEGLSFGSDQPIRQLADVTPSGYAADCGGGLTGLGTTSVTCLGNTNASVGDLVTYTIAPTQVSAAFTNSGTADLQGVAFGVLVSKVGLSKTVAARAAAGDSFGLNISDAAGNTIATADTGTSGTATTGAQAVLSGIPPVDYTFSESGDGSTDLAQYTQSWSCTNGGQSDPGLPSGSGTTKTVAVAIGDDIECTITNSPPVEATPITPMITPAAEVGAGGIGVLGLGLIALRRRRPGTSVRR
jgi:hypothetical protein